MVERIECHPQHFLRFHPKPDGLRRLQEIYGVTHQRHVWYENLVQLKYDQIRSPMGSKLVQQCRGIILDEAKNWQVIAWPFDKFFNYGEKEAAQIDWANCRIQEKLDGSLMIMYHYDDKWMVATSGSPDATGNIGDTGMVFSDLFWETFCKKGYSVPIKQVESLTFMFELTSPLNRVVVRHTEPDLRLLGIRHRLTGQEFSGNSNDYDCAPSFSGMRSIEALMASFDAMDPLKQEGYVVVDKHFNRVKVKHPGYILLHHMRGNNNMTHFRALKVALMGQTDELVAAFPEWTEILRGAEAAIKVTAQLAESDYEEIMHIVDQRAFAAQAVKTPYSFLLFGKRKGLWQTMEEGLRAQHPENLFDLLQKMQPRLDKELV